MDNLTLNSNSICAFCNTTTDNQATGFLQAFNQEFISNPLFQLNFSNGGNYFSSNCEYSLPGNWSICGNCLPQVQLLLGSKQKVDKVDSEVRYLQKRILTEMKCLVEEVDKMSGEMVIIEGILKDNPVMPTITRKIYVKKKKRGRKPSNLTNEERMLVQFREKIFNVLKDLQTFRAETSNKLLLNNFQTPTETLPILEPPRASPPNSEQLPVPNLKIKIDNELDDDDMEDNYFMSPTTSPPPNSPPPPKTETLQPVPPDMVEEGQPRKRKRKSIPLQKPAEYEGLDLTSSSDDEIPEDFHDFEFDPRQKASVKLNKKISSFSIFRKALISRIREHSTIATSSSLPSSKSDPRRPFSIKYNSITNEFSLADIPINCLDSENTLQCSQCNYSINSKNCFRDNRERNIEDWIFDHILSKHLNAYLCKLCGKCYQSGTTFKEHLRSHDLEFACDICQRPLSTGTTLKAHKWTHLSEEEKKDPNYASWMPSEVKNDRGLRFQCETCGKGFKIGRHLREHEITHLDPEERGKVMCTDCGKQVFLRSLKIHQNKWCEKVKGPPKGLDCKVCGENVRTLRELHEHLKERHPEERIWGCEVCGGNFKTKWHLRRHQEIHEEGYKFICERCGRGFKQRRNKKRHEGTCKGGGDSEGGRGNVKKEELNI